MSNLSCCSPPSSSLPPVRSLRTSTPETITAALHSLQALYCPLRLPVTFLREKHTTATQTDSGYVSDEDEDEVTPQQRRYSCTEYALAALRADEFEKGIAVRWLTSLIARAQELPFDSDEAREKVIDDAAFVLSSFSDSTNEEDEALTRDFSFPTLRGIDIHVQINDAPLTGADHTDVGLQSWGASIVFSRLMCESPERFCLDLLPTDASIVELGAGTGLIALTLGKLLPVLAKPSSILATDYHPVVLKNLRNNIDTNFGSSQAPVSTRLLDWSLPPASLVSSVDMLFAADVVYAPEHAAWLRDCAAHLLAPTGTFWLVVTVRNHGKFQGIPDTAETAFEDFEGTRRADGRVLRITAKDMLDKQRGVGRGDENGYMLFKIEWSAD